MLRSSGALIHLGDMIFYKHVAPLGQKTKNIYSNFSHPEPPEGFNVNR